MTRLWVCDMLNQILGNGLKYLAYHVVLCSVWFCLQRYYDIFRQGKKTGKMESFFSGGVYVTIAF